MAADPSLGASMRGKRTISDRDRDSRLVVLDGDDTLWQTQALYDDAKSHFAALFNDLPVSPTEIVDQLDRLDAHRAADIGYAPTRFRDSMLATYRSVMLLHHGAI